MVKLEWKKLWHEHPYLKYIVFVFVFLLSLKPAELSWHLLQAGYYFQVDRHLMQKHMEMAITIRPKVYQIFKKYSYTAADDALMKSLIIQGKRSLLVAALPKKEDMVRFQKKYKNNVYLRFLFPGLLSAKPMLENLDDVSLALLADKKVNHLTLQVFKPLLAGLSPFFMENVADYCRWQGNTELAAFWAAQARPRLVKGKPFVPTNPVTTAIDTQTSLARLGVICTQKFNFSLDTADIRVNLLQAGSFNEPQEWETVWSFSDVADVVGLGSGSFTVGPQRQNGNGLLRLMGFFVKNNPDQRPARGGVRLDKIISLDMAYYIFSFDYAAQTGKESVSFYLGDYLGERRLPAVKGLWKKTVLLINNLSGKYNQVQPIIRMWGKGTLLVDNVCLFKLGEKTTTLPTKTTLLVEDALNPAQGESQ